MFPSKFDRSALPQAKAFYERELGRLTRPDRKGNCLGNCPFHKSKSKKSFSVNINTGLWWCFACNIGGDMVKFVMLRYRLDFPRAAQYLGAWRDNPTEEQSRQVREAHQERERQLSTEVAQEEAERQQRIEARNHLHMLEGVYDDASDQLGELRGHPGGQSELCWELMEDALPEIREYETRYWQLSGLEVRHER